MFCEISCTIHIVDIRDKADGYYRSTKQRMVKIECMLLRKSMNWSIWQAAFCSWKILCSRHIIKRFIIYFKE